MPTGYTAAIKDGITFKQFVMGCARAMGALIDMRDEPTGAPIPERFEPSPWYANALAEAKAELARFEAMTDDEAREAAIGDHHAAVDSWQQRQADKAALAQKYNAMLEKVREWTPPTADHQGFKDFMIQQLEDSLAHDCRASEGAQPPLIPFAEWRAQNIESYRRTVDYRAKALAEELQRTEERNTWLRQLRESLAKD